MITDSTMALVCCPSCGHSPLICDARQRQGEIILDADLRCSRCTTLYPVREGVPNLIPSHKMSGKRWELWKNHLDGFQARREMRANNPQAFTNSFSEISSIHHAFAEFINQKNGTLLDVGCGPGNFRFLFNNADARYIGIDPIPLLDTKDFEFLCALGEYIPIRNSSVDHVTVLAALDHFSDIDAFLSEIVRILKPNGRLYLLQSVHEISGVIGSLKWLAHEVKDKLEDRTTAKHHAGTPKHMSEFSNKSLIDTINSHFSIEVEQRYSPGLLNPELHFLTLAPRPVSAPHSYAANS